MLHDVINDRFARKAVEKGADGLIAVAAGAGGHAGTTSPFALVQEIRAGSTGRWRCPAPSPPAARSSPRRPWAPTSPTSARPSSPPHEARAADGYKQMIVDGTADDIVYTNLFTGVHGNYLRASIVARRARPRRAAASDPSKMNFGSGDGASQGRGRTSGAAARASARSTQSCRRGDLVARLQREYQAARQRLRVMEEA